MQVETEPGEVSFTNKLSAKHVLLTRRSVSVTDTNKKTRPDGQGCGPHGQEHHDEDGHQRPA